jgi:hypothetical protein
MLSKVAQRESSFEIYVSAAMHVRADLAWLWQNLRNIQFPFQTRKNNTYKIIFREIQVAIARVRKLDFELDIFKSTQSKLES